MLELEEDNIGLEKRYLESTMVCEVIFRKTRQSEVSPLAEFTFVFTGHQLNIFNI